MHLKAILIFFASLVALPVNASIIYSGAGWMDYARALRQIRSGSYTGKDTNGNICQVDIIEDSSLCESVAKFPGCPSSPAEVVVTVKYVSGGFSDFESPPKFSGGDVDLAKIVDFTATHPSQQETTLHLQINHFLAEQGYLLETLDLTSSVLSTGVAEATSIVTSVGDAASGTSTLSPDAITTTCTDLVFMGSP